MCVHLKYLIFTLHTTDIFSQDQYDPRYHTQDAWGDYCHDDRFVPQHVHCEHNDYGDRRGVNTYVGNCLFPTAPDDDIGCTCTYCHSHFILVLSNCQTWCFVHGVWVWCVLTHMLSLTKTQTGDVVSVLDMTIVRESSPTALRSARNSIKTPSKRGVFPRSLGRSQKRLNSIKIVLIRDNNIYLPFAICQGTVHMSVLVSITRDAGRHSRGIKTTICRAGTAANMAPYVMATIWMVKIRSAVYCIADEPKLKTE